MNPVLQPLKHELVAKRLRDGIREGHWSGNLPGVLALAAELDVAPNTVRRALRRLESEGLLADSGLGRSRCIVTTEAGASAAPLAVGILHYDERRMSYSQTWEVITEITDSLEAAGHTILPCKRSQQELRHDPRRIATELAKTPADAWLIIAGSFPVLEWCAAQSTPFHALYGRFNTLPLAGTGLDKAPAFRAATRQLLSLGHRRIVYIVDEARRKPAPGINASAFLQELTAHGIPTGDYNLPDWEASPTGFSELLERLFLHTPPTALIVDEPVRYIAAAEFLARRGIGVPQRVSLVSTNDDPSFAWCHPGVAHMRWDNAPIVRRVARWVDAVRKGKPDRKSVKFPAEFVPGASIGPVWKS
jgi:DNA-binding LacI/PurR family transcriptional regulator